MLELCEAFYSSPAKPATRLRLRTEVLAGTWEALVTGQADLAIGVGSALELPSGVTMKDLGPLPFVFAVAPHHPLAGASEPLDDAELIRHRAVAVADSAQRLAPITVNLLPGQDVLTVSNMQTKIEAQLRSLGCGFVPEPMARDHIAAGRLVVKTRAAGAARVASRLCLAYAGGEQSRRRAQAAARAGAALVAGAAGEPGHAQCPARAPWQPRRRARSARQAAARKRA